MKHNLYVILLLLVCGIGHSQIQFETDFGETNSSNPASGNRDNIILFDNKIFLTAERFGLTTGYIFTYDGSTHEQLLTGSGLSQVVSTLPAFLTRQNSSNETELWFTAFQSNGNASFLVEGASFPQVAISGGIVQGLQATMNNEVYTAFSSTNFDVLVITNQAGNTSISSMQYSSGSVTKIFAFNNKLYLSASDGTNGVELHEYDPTTDTSSLVMDINTSGDSSPSDFVEANGKFYFTADPGTGRELYVYDPNSIINVSKIDIIANNSEDPKHLTYFQSGANNYIILSADAGTGIGREPIRINTANDSATLLSVRSGTDGSDPSGFTVYNGFVYFSANNGSDGVELYRTNGTAVGTTQVSDINSSGGSNPNSFLEYNNELYFQANGDAVGVELYKVNASNVASLVEDFQTGTDNFNPIPLIVYDGKLYLSGQSASTSEVHLYSYEITNTYIGASGGDWSVASNWSDGVVPTATSSAIIPASSNVQITSSGAECLDLDTSGGSALFIAPGASLTVKRDWISSTGSTDIDLNNTSSLTSTLGAPSFIVERNLAYGIGRIETTRKQPINEWVLVSSPLLDAAISDYSTQFATGTASNIGFAPYNNSLVSPWEYFTAGNVTGNFVSGKGYSALLTINAGIYLGNYNADNTSISLVDGTVSNWNLVGNPFTAAIAANNSASATSNVILDNTSELDPSFQALYFWDATENSGNGAYVVINHTSPSYHIPIGQGFFVNSKTGGGILTLNESLQSHQTGTDNFRSTSTNTPEIKILAATNSDKKSTLVRYLSNTTRGLDSGFDAGQFDGVDQDLQVYTQLLDQNQGINFALQALPEDYENQIIPIGLKAAANEEITFTVEAQNLPQDMKVFLEDKETQIITRLDTQGADYTVTLNASEDGTGRFFLHTSSSAVLSNPTFNEEDINMYVSQRRLKALGLNPGNYNVQMHNLLGQLIFDQKLDVDSTIDLAIPNTLKTGVYIVKLTNRKVNFSRKIILK